MSSEVLGRFLLDVAHPGLPHALWLLDLALLLAEEAVEVTTPATKAPVTAQQPRVSEQMFFFSVAATSTGGKDGDESCAQPCCHDGAWGWHLSPAAQPGVCWGREELLSLQWGCLPSAFCPRVLGLVGRPVLPRELTEPGHGRDGTAPHTRAAGSWPAGEEPSTGERRHWQCSPLPMESCLSVCLSVIELGVGP